MVCPLRVMYLERCLVSMRSCMRRTCDAMVVLGHNRTSLRRVSGSRCSRAVKSDLIPALTLIALAPQQAQALSQPLYIVALSFILPLPSPCLAVLHCGSLSSRTSPFLSVSISFFIPLLCRAHPLNAVDETAAPSEETDDEHHGICTKQCIPFEEFYHLAVHRKSWKPPYFDPESFAG
ncbi:hypothetical protein KC19_2G007100 [Ceratodon purpureus]|uniref:Uncharacterized protein n=1 Tax=Ceratodon purpureus TaxID=3225 RepID=A0A8T0IRC6_CERPU|nr:hypothetical protein KC19_2G007100 [Ceratodon purpureus]